MVLSLDQLPDEILHSILCYIHPCSAAALEQTASRFRLIANEALLWRFYCQTHFKFWDSKHEIPRKLMLSVSSVNWKQLYVVRHMIDREITRVLDSILASQTGRIEKFHTIINFGYDAKDTLLRHSLAEPGAEDYLARSYYARTLLASLHRNVAVPEWARLRESATVPLERALGAFDLFIPESGFGQLDEITSMLDGISTRLKASYPDIEHLTSREKAFAVASYLKTNNLTGIQPGREYHSLEHNFLGFALSDPEHNSLPLVSAAIYCYVAQSIGLNARPCGFPFHVHVIILPPLGLDMDGNILDAGGSSHPMYMDPFRSDKETPITDLQTQLNFLGASTMEQSAFLGESLTSEIVLRCGKNILNSVQHASHLPSVHTVKVDIVSAKYAALWSSMLLAGASRPVELQHHLPWLMETFATDFPSDIYLVEQYIVPLFRGMLEYDHILESLHVMRAVDEIPKQVRRRGAEQRNVRYRIGQVFRHRRYNYRAIITGWDAECGAGEQWMRRMGIDRLRGGRHQSFYHVLVEDKSVRYVAEENIHIITPHITELPRSLTAVAGKHFKRWDEENRTFVSNIRDEYPDD